MIWAKLQAPAADLPEAQQPDWLLFISPVWYGMDLLRFGSAYVGSAAFAAGGIMTGRIPRLPGWIMIAFSLIAAVLGVFTDLPFFIPALTCLVPYFLGMTLRRSDNLNFQKKAGRQGQERQGPAPAGPLVGRGSRMAWAFPQRIAFSSAVIHHANTPAKPFPLRDEGDAAALRLGKQTGADRFVIEIIGHLARDFRQFGSLALPTDEQELVPTEKQKGPLRRPFFCKPKLKCQTLDWRLGQTTKPFRTRHPRFFRTIINRGWRNRRRRIYQLTVIDDFAHLASIQGFVFQ